jgi:hypothetical protein
MQQVLHHNAAINNPIARLLAGIDYILVMSEHHFMLIVSMLFQHAAEFVFENVIIQFSTHFLFYILKLIHPAHPLIAN